MRVSGPCASLNLHLCCRLFDAHDHEVLTPSSLRTSIASLPADASVEIRMLLKLPREPGNYRARISCVHEGIAWWTDLASHGYDLAVTLTP